MKQKLENVIRNKKVMIALMEILIAIGCIVIFYLMMSSNNRAKETTYSYSKVEEPAQYRVVDNYITRVMPLTSYETFKEIAENTLNAASEDVQYTVKVYSDAEKTEEITDGYIGSGMIVEAIEKTEETATEEQTKIESEETIEEQLNEELPEENVGITYTVSVIGDMTGDGEINIIELTKLIKGVVGLTDWRFTEEEKLTADISGDIEINVVDIELCIDYIVFGKLDFEEATFTVKFKDYDGKVISTKDNYHYGDTIEVPEEPTREPDEMYTYEFAGWEPVISEKVTKDEEYVATYKAIEIATEAGYKVEHYKETKEGTYVLAETEELVGKIGEEVTATAKEYTGFSENVESEDRIPNGTVLEDGSLVLKLYYDRNTYTVTFKDEDGTILSEKTDYHYGDTIEIPENPTKAEDNTYTYEFAGWTPEVSETVTGDVEYTATYTSIYKEYTVVFKNEDGTVLSEKIDYHYGDTIEIPGNPTKPEDNTYTYVFAGWSPEVSETVTGDAEYIATYTSVYKEYTVEFKNEDGNVITSKNYHYGDTVEVPENPTKAEDNTYTYEFAGWSPEVSETVSGDAEYIATYTSVYREYTIEFKSDDGTVLSTNKYHYGDTVEIPEAPEKEADENYEYEFIGWGKEVTTVTKDEVYTATYNAISYKISVEKEDGTTVKYISFEKAFNEVTDDNITVQLIGDITESINIPEGKNITLDLNDHKITSDKEVTITNNGTLLIVDNSIEKGGQIENTNNAAIINNGNLTIGYNDGAVEENIFIQGVTNAIKNNSNFYMYDGTLIGKTTITGNNAVIPEGEEYGLSIKEENGMQIATIKIIEIPAALVGDTYYMTLQEAIDENNNTTIYVVKKNVEVVDTVIVDETKTLTIDLNGNTLTKESSGYVIENSGTLTVTNTNETKEGNISNTAGHVIYNKETLNLKGININSYNYGVHNGKDLNIEDVNIESSNSYGVYNGNSFIMTKGSIKGNKGIYSSSNSSNQIKDTIIDTNNSAINSYSEKIEIVDTTIKAKSTGIYISGSDNEVMVKNSTIDVEYTSYNEGGIRIQSGDGKILLENTKVNVTTTSSTAYGIYNNSSSEYDIVIDKNTQIISNSTSSTSYGIYGSSNQNGMYADNVQLIDGNIFAIGKKGYGVHLNSGYFDFLGGSIKATTETINATIGSIAEGKQIQTIQEEDKYVSTLIDAEYTDYIASVGEEQFYTLEDAINFCTSTEEASKITILSDFEQSQSISISEVKNIIIDLNGKKITAYGEFINEGQLEVTDSSSEQVGTIEEKRNRAILNKGNAIFTLSSGSITLNNTSSSKYGIHNIDQASINIKDGSITVNNGGFIIYNKSKGNIEIGGGILKGYSRTGDTTAIYNFVDDAGGDRNINITGGNIELSGTYTNAQGIYNYTTHNSNVTDTSRDTINLNISNYNINIKVSVSSNPCGIYNYINYGRDTIVMNLQDSILDITNSYGYSYSYAGAYGIYNSAPNTAFIYNNITGGSIKAERKNEDVEGTGIYNSGNITIDIGTEGEEYIQEPNIFGEKYGICSGSTSTINFFQGIIKGTGAINETTILNLEEGKEINRYTDEEDNYDTIVIQNKTPEAKIGVIEYMTLQEAIDACPDDATESTTIELIKEVSNTATSVTVGEKKKVTLDLKGYNVTSLAERTIVNNGNLNIIDSEGTGSIKNNSKIAIGNYGELTMNTISVYGKTIGIANYQNADAELNEVNIDASSEGVNNKGSINFNSSAITMTAGTYGVYNSGSMNFTSSNISIKCGNGPTYGIYNSGNVANIKNSNITNENTGSYYNHIGYAIYVNSGTVNISDKESGPEDTSMISSSHVGIRKSTTYASTKVNYYGGKIISKEKLLDGGLDEILEAKEILVSEEDSKKVATLVDKQEGNVIKIGNTEYENIEKAINSIPEELEEQTEMQLISDIKINCSKERISIPKGKNIKLDLNGYEVVSYDQYAISNKGKFEIIDTSLEKTGKIISEFNSGINNDNGELTINGGYINAKRIGISNSNNGIIVMNSGTIDIEANESTGSSAITSNTGTVNLCGGNINVTKEKGAGGNFTYNIYAAGIYASAANLTIDGTNINLTNNQSGAYTYGIRTNRSTINYKSGTMYVGSTYYGSAYGIFGYSYDSGSFIEINGGSIEVINAIQSGYGIRLESESGTNNVYMTAGKLKTNCTNSNGGSSTGIYCRINNENCGVNITGGTIEATGTSGGTAISGSNITIGTKDGDMSKTSPVIEGKSCGINSENLNFYDGTIRGKTALSKMPVDVEAGYKVNIATSGEVQSATLTLVSTAEAIAQIGNLYFNNLQQAINACGDTDTIKILAGIKCSEPLTIEEGKTVTIDLMGNNIEANGIENVIVNYGTLTIIDSVGGGSIGTIDNQGQLNQ